MISPKWRLMKHLARLYDLGAIVAGFVFATFVLSTSPSGMSLAEFMALRIKLGNFMLFVLLLFVWHNIFAICGLYTSKRLTPKSTELLRVCKATLLASVFLFLVGLTFHIEMVSPRFVTLLWIFCTTAMIFGRLVSQFLLVTLRRKGRNSRFLLIVGTNRRAIEFANLIQERPELGYHIVGFVDDEWPGLHKFEATDYTRSCSFTELAEFLRHNVVDELAIYLPLGSYYERASQLVTLCELHGIMIRIDSQIFKSANQDSQVLELDEHSQVVAVEGSTKLFPSVVKRIFDFVASAILLFLLAPVFVGVALLVYFTSEGPILFRQARVGLNKRQFNIYKFRTMIAEAEKAQLQLLSMNEMAGPVFKIKDDPRITPLGRILRKSSIDELPQLFNVLKGEMSLVGPRAMSVRDYRLFEQDWHRRRFSVKPGITCLWQINGRNSIPFEQWMELDLQYIDKWSLWLDLKILVQTVPAVLRGTGAA
jgi:exopolysaccharide biosynthesis polyprenyl glycosylphosphotransferase